MLARTLKPTTTAFDAAGKRDVGFGDAADARVHDARLDLVGAELLQARPTMASTEPCTSPLMTKGELLPAGAILQLLHHLLERALGVRAEPSVSRRFRTR